MENRELKQYCRYCAEASIYGNDTFACCKDNQLYDKSKSTRVNKCKNFVFCPNDLWRCDEHGNFKQYKPREKKKKLDQIKIDIGRANNGT